ncbi:MAG TPA: hypothetical protein VF198_11575 [Vicinamibacterales bacterium]
MSEPDEIPLPSQLWKSMTESQRLQAAEAFWRDTEIPELQVEAATLLAQRLKARPRFIAGLPIEKKARHLVRMPAMPDVLAARLLVSYHLGCQRPMMGAFLDRLGIPHEDGLINDDLDQAIPPEKLDEAAQALKASFPAEDVRLYFATLLAQDPETWGGLKKQL